MHTIIHPPLPKSRTTGVEPTSPDVFRQPNYDCQERAGNMQLVVYVPGVEAAGVEIEAHGADLTITARKSHFVRVNWQSLHLEQAQRDYRLRLRLGTGFDYSATLAEIRGGVLTLTLPKRPPVAQTVPARRRRAA
jgi:HSP20 family protein